MWKPEYYVRLVKLPSSVEGAIMPNSDGSFDIYINSALPEIRREDVLRHELRHLTDDHFYRSELSVGQAESAASGVVGLPSLTVVDGNNQRRKVTVPTQEYIREFHSLDALLEFALQNGGV